MIFRNGKDSWWRLLNGGGPTLAGRINHRTFLKSNRFRRARPPATRRQVRAPKALVISMSNIFVCRFVMIGLLAIATQLVLSQPALALQDYFNAFKGRYPAWPTTSSFNCRACHDSSSGGGSRNAYGNAFLSKKGPNIVSQSTARNIIIDLENEDPDGDDYLSLTEISRTRLPGYAVGAFSQPTNVVTFSSAPKANSNPINSGASTGVRRARERSQDQQ